MQAAIPLLAVASLLLFSSGSAEPKENVSTKLGQDSNDKGIADEEKNVNFSPHSKKKAYNCANTAILGSWKDVNSIRSKLHKQVNCITLEHLTKTERISLLTWGMIITIKDL